MATSVAEPKASPATTKPRSAKKPGAAETRLKAITSAAILLKQASDPTRLSVLLMLLDGEKHVGEICTHVNMTQPGVSHHLAISRHGGIIYPRRQGKNNFYNLTDKGRALAEVAKGLIEG